MIVPSLQRFSLLALVIWFSTVLGAYDISTRKEPLGPLGVRLDYSLATAWPPDRTDATGRNFQWSSHLTFASPVSTITDGQLWQIAFDAYGEMLRDMTQYTLGNRHKPKVMTILAFGNEIILASSQKGKASFIYQPRNTRVRESLELCQMVWQTDGPGGGNVRHKSDGSCGEVMATHLYYSTHDEDNAPLSSQQARIGAATFDNDQPTRVAPCGDPQADTWGCNLFVAAEGLIVLGNDVTAEPYELDTLAGGRTAVDQIELCS